MLSLDEYPVVDADANLIDAIRALDESHERLPSGRHLHRAVLVGRDGEILGRLGHFAFLEALFRKESDMFRGGWIEQAGVSDELRQTTMSHLRVLAGDQVGLCDTGRSVRVRDVMRPATQRIDEDATLMEAIEMLVATRSLSLLVTRGSAVVGVIRSSDVFNEVAHVLRGCTPGGE
jgi:CBS domain-containing protein